jgi:hypothetical protein
LTIQMHRPAASSALVLVLLLLGGRLLAADDIQSWTEVEIGVLETDRLAWSVEGVARIRDALGSAYDRRVNTDVDVRLSDSVTLTLGYNLRNRTRTGFGFGWDHRLRTEVTYPLLRRDFRVEATTLYERHIGRPDVPDFNRYRQQVEVERPHARLSPWLYQSVAFVRSGFVRSRSRVGVRWRAGTRYTVIGAYQFERIRSGSTWRPRHAIYSEWSLDLAANRAAARRSAP